MKIIILLLLICLQTRISIAQTITWDGPATGSWHTAANWNSNTLPDASDVVGIPAGVTVTYSMTTNTITGLLLDGTLRITGGTLTIASDLDVSSSGTLQITGGTINGNDINVSSSGVVSATQVTDFTIRGDLLNNGSFTSTGATRFQGSANQLVSGTGLTTSFNRIIILNTGPANNNIVEIASTNFTASDGFLNNGVVASGLISGILKISGTFSHANRLFPLAAPIINADEGIWLNNPNFIVSAQDGSTTLNGLLRISAGTYNIGTTNGSLTWANNAIFRMDGGSMNIAASFSPSSATSTDLLNFTSTAGILTLSMGSLSTPNSSSTLASFDIPSTGLSSFTMSGGMIVIQKPAAAIDYRMATSVPVNITGGSVQFGNISTSGSPNFKVGIASGAANVLPGLIINANGTPKVTILTTATIRGNVNVGAGTTLDTTNQPVTVLGN